jgi:arylsulfatase A-like enzyme
VDTSDAPPSSRSLVAAMRDPTSAVRGAVMAESGHRRMVRAGDWKLIFENDPAGLELYNLAEDPMEQHNLARDDADPERLTSEAGRWERVAGLLGEFAHLTAGCEPRAE